MPMTRGLAAAAALLLAAPVPGNAARPLAATPIGIDAAVTCSARPDGWHFLDGEQFADYDEFMAALEAADAAAAGPQNLGIDFTCNTTSVPARSAERPTSVHALRPGDIDIVAAVGDSITAAFGAKAGSLLTDWIEYRGVSWSIGGDNDLSRTFTLPNVLRKFNPNVKGMSLGTYTSLFGGKKVANRAVSGARASDMPAQAREVVDWINGNANDVKNDWKLVTLFIGGNDLCSDVCENKDSASADSYENYIRTALHTLTDGLERVFVNLVQVVDVTQLYEVSGGLCSLLHGFECSCGASSSTTTRDSVTAMANEYWKRVETIAQDDAFARDDFAVVVQPFFTEIELPRCDDGKPDRSFFAPDCFHFSEKGHQAAAEALWNSMIEPVGSKKTSWVVGEGVECPTAEHPFIRTSKN